ncbi:MAG: HAD family phosphatase [Sulfolobaceae archaeon]
MIRGVIFDLDGTLVDAEIAHLKAWYIALEELGIKLRGEIDIKNLFGLRTIEIAEIIAGKENARILAERKTQIFKEIVWKYAKPVRCSIEVINHIMSKGLKIAVVTSSSRAAAIETLKILGYLPEILIAGDDVEKGKPDPFPILMAISKMGLRPNEVIGVGDTINDLLAYHSAGLAMIFILKNDKIVSNDLRNFTRLKIIENLCELLNYI